jgi:ethanolamine utilization protein EutQ (cupin superfamily)
MSKLENKNFSSPDKVMTPPKSKMEIVTFGERTVIKMTFQAGWKWSADINPSAGQEMCQMHHFGYQLSGVLHVQSTTGDGREIETKAGDIVDIPPGHDAWVVGENSVEFIDFGGTP